MMLWPYFIPLQPKQRRDSRGAFLSKQPTNSNLKLTRSGKQSAEFAQRISFCRPLFAFHCFRRSFRPPMKKMGVWVRAIVIKRS